MKICKSLEDTIKIIQVICESESCDIGVAYFEKDKTIHEVFGCKDGNCPIYGLDIDIDILPNIPALEDIDALKIYLKANYTFKKGGV